MSDAKTPPTPPSDQKTSDPIATPIENPSAVAPTSASTEEKKLPWYGVRVEVGNPTSSVIAGAFGLIAAIVGFFLAPTFQSYVDRSNRVVDAEHKAELIKADNDKLQAELAEAQKIRAANERIALYGPDFWFYWQFDAERTPEGFKGPVPIPGTGGFVIFEGTHMKDGSEFVTLTVNSPLLNPITASYFEMKDPNRRGEVAWEPPFDLLVADGARTIRCTDKADLIVAIEEAERKELRIGIAFAPGTRKIPFDMSVPNNAPDAMEAHARYGLDSGCARFDR